MDTKVLTGQVALVTGASRGLGRQFARTLAAAGAHVAVMSRTMDDCQRVVAEIHDRGGTALAVAADVTDRGQLEEAAATVTATLGPVDVLVNNAGISSKA